MTEPLAATLLSGGGAGDALGSGRRAAGLAMGCCAGAAARRAGAGPRPEYLAVAAARSRWSSSLAQAARRLAAIRWLRPRCCSPAALVVIAPWTIRNAVALDRFVPISTGGGQVLFAGTYLPSDGDPEKVGAEVVDRQPGAASRPRRRATTCGSSRSSRGSPPQRYPGAGNRPALSKMGKEQLWDDVTEEPLEYAGFVADQGLADLDRTGRGTVMREPAWEVAALGAGRLRPARPRRPRLAAPLGGAARSASSSSRSPRSAPCWWPRRGAMLVVLPLARRPGRRRCAIAPAPG